MNAKPSAAILEAVAEKISALREFLAFTETLQQQLQNKNLVDIPHLIKERDLLIQKMDQADRQTGLDRLDPSRARKKISGSLQSRFDSMVRELRDLLEQTTNLDHQCFQEAQAWKEAIRDELTQFRKNSRVARAYIGRRTLPPRFKDTRE
jgi:hypothetical protein